MFLKHNVTTTVINKHMHEWEYTGTRLK